MSDVTAEKIQAALADARVPHLDETLASAGVPVDVEVSGTTASIMVTLGFPAAGIAEAYARELQDMAVSSTGVEKATVGVTWDVKAHAVQGALAPLENVKNIIAIASGKGGVGKSTTAVNLALALVREGARVGVLDADVYGPSQPRMLGISGQRVASSDGKTMQPLEAHGVQTISMGFLVDEDKPMIWRGPMVTQAVNQLIFQTNWDNLDYLIVDLPPGTGDTQLTLTQSVPLSGAIIITTPQDIALLDALKGLKMFETVNVPILGVIENMSSHVCSACGHEEHLFGKGGGERLARDNEVPLLGQLPLHIDIRRQADGGEPTVAVDPEGHVAMRYRDIARTAAAILSLRARDRKAAFPRVVVEPTQ